MTATFSIEQLIALNDEIGSLVRGGVPIELGLRELGGDSSGALQQISQALAVRMESGATLAEALQAEAQKKAIADARNKAEQLARALGVRLGDVKSFSASQRTPEAAPMYGQAADMKGLGAGPSVAVPPGSQEIRADVTITYSLR